jgi:hypothetical protein
MTRKLGPAWQHPAAARDFIQQVRALHEHITALLPGSEITDSKDLLNLRHWALYCLNELRDNPALAIGIGQGRADSARSWARSSSRGWNAGGCCGTYPAPAGPAVPSWLVPGRWPNGVSPRYARWNVAPRRSGVPPMTSPELPPMA